jgi:hypothetical protein
VHNEVRYSIHNRNSSQGGVMKYAGAVVLLVLAPINASQTPAAGSSELLLRSKTVAIIGQTGKQMVNRGWANPNGYRAKEKVAAVLTEWGRYQIVEDPGTADLILVVFESQKNVNLIKLANLVAELKAHPGGQVPTEQTPSLWSGQAGESFRKMPATAVAEKFRDYVKKLENPGPGKN